MGFVDRLNRIEEYEILDKNKWIDLRANRNKTIDKYSYNEEKIVENANIIYKKFDSIASNVNQKILDDIVI